MTDVECAAAAARWWVARGGSDDWREWVGVAWEGLAARAASRARRGLPPMDDRRRYLAARSAIIDHARLGRGGYGDSRYRPAWLVPVSVLDPEGEGWLEPAARVSAVVPEVPRVAGYRRWAAAEDGAMRKALRAGATAADVARGLGRTPRAVWHRCHHLGFRVGRVGSPPDPVPRSRLLAAVAAGSTLRAASRSLGVAFSQVQRMTADLVRAGRLVRAGGATSACRYVPARRM